MPCLFCRGPGPFNTREHIVPASLGNDDAFLEGMVCDGCQNYLAREVEGPALTHTPIGVWRVLLRTPTKKGNPPQASLGAAPKGRIPSSHWMEDSITFEAHHDDSVSATIDEDATVQAMTSGNKSNFRMVLTPWHIQSLGRLLGKMGLEFVATHDRSAAFGSRFDPMRNYVRRGSTSRIWPVYLAADQGRSLRKLLPDGDSYEVECYRYELGQVVDGNVLFGFGIGTDIYAINLTDQQPNTDPGWSKSARFQCLHYDAF